MPKLNKKSLAAAKFGYEAQLGQMPEVRCLHLFVSANRSMASHQAGDGEAVDFHWLGAGAA